MRFIKWAGIILALSCLQGVFAQTQDTVWLCREDTSEAMYVKMYLSDTFPDNRGAFSMVDTGDALSGKYINFDYQFGNPHPGYAGFKMFWDYGVASFWVQDYDSLIFWHKGPLPGHKVRMVWAQGSAGCGTPINYEYFGEYMSSSTWKRESFPFPPGFVKNGLFELRMLIYNDSIGADTSSISAKGNLKIDNMYFYKGPARALVIQTQPQSQTVEDGSAVTFTVVADGSAPSYQWQKDGNPIDGATLPTYTISSAKAIDAGSYTVVVINSLGSITSNAATLTVTAQQPRALVIQTQPQPQTVEEGGPAAFTVVVDGSSPSYQWKKDGNPISGATSATYTIDSAKAGDAGSYTVVITNSLGSITSNAAALTVNVKEAPAKSKKSGCGSGAAIAFIPPLFYKTIVRRKRKNHPAV